MILRQGFLARFSKLVLRLGELTIPALVIRAYFVLAAVTQSLYEIKQLRYLSIAHVQNALDQLLALGELTGAYD